MSKLLLILTILIMAIPVYAQDIEVKPAVMADILYDAKEGSIVPVISLQIATLFDNLIETRVMAIGNTEDLTKLDKVGIGIGVNLVTLTNKFGQKWTADFINPTLGIAPIYSFSKKTINFGIYMTVIQIKF